ncbi:MAG: ATP-binding protein [Planctomycetes bacterium]|nr:ATP-binding protein [Planctomycetota bacterium]
MNPFKYGCTVGGDDFCPRPKLARALEAFIESGQNVVMQGERRTGKTSLVLETVRNMKGVALFHADFLGVRDHAEFCGRLASALARLERSDGWLTKILRAIAHLRPLVSIDPASGAPTVSLDAKLAEDPASLDAVLTMLVERTAERKTCVVMDEFQDILDLEDGERVLAVMRGRIQLDSDTAYVFLGSVRNRMTDIFWKPQSPFFHSAAALPVGEIDEEDFFPFIQGRFKTAGRTMAREAFAAAYAMASRNPGYMQELCEALWETSSQGDALRTEDMAKALDMIFDREREHYVFYIKQLTALQARVLRALAQNDGGDVGSQKFLESANVYNRTSVKKAIAKIEKEDIVYWHEDKYRFVNPFFREWVKRMA